MQSLPQALLSQTLLLLFQSKHEENLFNFKAYIIITVLRHSKYYLEQLKF